MVEGDRNSTPRRLKLVRPGTPRWQPPQWSGSPYEKWAKGYVAKHLWRVRHLLMSYDDALQECALTYLVCCREYKEVDNAAWLMALYMRAVANNFHTFAKHDRRQVALRQAVAVERPDSVEFNNGPLFLVLNRASEELRDVLRAVANAPSELLVLMLDGIKYRRPGPKARNAEAAVSRALCRFARTRRVRDDLLAELRDLLRAD